MSSLARPAPPPAASAWSPLRHRVFASLWGASVVSNIGTWMNTVGAGWLMTTLNPAPQAVALVQASTALAVFFFALPAGAIGDLVDRRKLLVAVNTGGAIIAAALAWTVASGAINEYLLLFFVFSLGSLVAISAPTWQALVPYVVRREELASAIALNSMGFNISRAIGPVLAGFLIVGVGMAAPFALNALSFVGIIAVLLWWRRKPDEPGELPPQRVLPAVRSGLRYAFSSRAVRATLVRAAAYLVFTSAFWSLLPLIAREHLQGDATMLGYLLGAVGFGAVCGAMVLPRARESLGLNGVVAWGTVFTAIALAVIALLPYAWFAAGACMLLGVCWIATVSSLHVSAHTALPNWVRARGLSVYMATFFGAMFAGSVLWGQIAGAFSLPTALIAAAASLVLALPMVMAVRLGQGENMDLSPSRHWTAPPLLESDAYERGPVMVSVEYDVAAEDRRAFVVAINELARVRRRDGGYQWSVFQDVDDPGRFVETFLVPNWLEHLRQHERVTAHDRQLEERVESFHRGAGKPRVRYLLAPGPRASDAEATEGLYS